MYVIIVIFFMIRMHVMTVTSLSIDIKTPSYFFDAFIQQCISIHLFIVGYFC